MKRRHRGVQRRCVECPECGTVFTYHYRPDVKYFRAPRERCPECGFVGRRGMFEKPDFQGGRGR